MTPKNDPTSTEQKETTGTITLAAYGAPFRIADKGNLYTASLKYDIPLNNRKTLNSINIYGAFNYLDKVEKQFEDTQMHILGGKAKYLESIHLCRIYTCKKSTISQ